MTHRPYRYEYARKTFEVDPGPPLVTRGAHADDGAPDLAEAITAGFPAPRVWSVNPNGTVVSFAVELTAPEKTTLDGIVATWDPDS